MSLTAAALAVMISSAAAQAPTPPPAGPIVIPEAAQAQAQAAQPDGTPAIDGATPDAPSGPAPDPAASAPEAGPADEAQGADIIVMPRKSVPGDPLARVNEQSFKAVQAVDAAVLGPVAQVYNKGLPRPLRQGLRNFFANLDEPIVFAAFLLELKPGKALETAGRFVINTTVGVGGLVDMAKRKPFNLPYRANGLADVMGYYGVGPGPFFYVPLIGPTTLRDLVGDTVDNLLLPTVVGKPFSDPKVMLPVTIMSQLGERAAFDDRIRKIREEGDPYSAYRDLYLKQRQAEIDALHGIADPGVIPVYGLDMPTAGSAAKAPARAAAAGKTH